MSQMQSTTPDTYTRRAAKSRTCHSTNKRTGATVLTGAAAAARYGSPTASTATVLIDGLQCTGDEASVAACDRSVSAADLAAAASAAAAAAAAGAAPRPAFVGVQCREPEYAARLVDGEHPSEGRLGASCVRVVARVHWGCIISWRPSATVVM